MLRTTTDRALRKTQEQSQQPIKMECSGELTISLFLYLSYAASLLSRPIKSDLVLNGEFEDYEDLTFRSEMSRSRQTVKLFGFVLNWSGYFNLKIYFDKIRIYQRVDDWAKSPTLICTATQNDYHKHH